MFSYIKGYQMTITKKLVLSPIPSSRERLMESYATEISSRNVVLQGAGRCWSTATICVYVYFDCYKVLKSVPFSM